MPLGVEKNLQLAVDTTPDNCNTTSATMTNFWQPSVERIEMMRRGFGFFPLTDHLVAIPLS
jgi:hypothetical protein